MTKNISEKIAEIKIALLQLQRSALIDTQTLMQLMIDKGLCDSEDIVKTRSLIENESKDIKRIDHQIEELGGTISHTPLPESMANKEALHKQLVELVNMLKEGDINNL